jgi:hypothetical protein
MDILHKMQVHLKVPKSNENKFGGYKYRSCEDILEAVKKVMPDGVSLHMSDDVVLLGDRVFLKSTATLMAADGVKIAETTGVAQHAVDKKGMDDAQISGAASSYARKYALNGLFAIDDTKDSDATNDHGKGQSTAKPKPSLKEVAECVSTIEQAMEDCKTIDALRELWKSTSTDRALLPKKEQDELVEYSKKRSAQLKGE